MLITRRRRRALLAVVAVVGLVLAVSRFVASFDVPALASSGPAASKTSAQREVDAVEADVVRVFDGDTIEVRIDGREARVRFLGVDTPERRDDGAHEALYEEAKRFTERALLAFPRLLDVGPSSSRSAIAPTLGAVNQIPQSFLQPLFVLSRTDTIHPGGPVLP